MQNGRYIAAGMLLGLTLLIGCDPKSLDHLKNGLGSGGDDEPVVVAGGSLVVGAHYGQFKVKGDDQVHADSNGNGGNDSKRFVAGVDLVYYTADNVPATVSKVYSGKVTTLMTYCVSDDPASDCETVTIVTGNTGQGFKITGEKRKAKDDDKPTAAAISHRPPEGKLKDVTLQGEPSHGCGMTQDQKLMGRCSLIFHYCTKAGCL
jgi:hypothetical protein